MDNVYGPPAKKRRKPARKVFVLIGERDYEASTFLGVFSTQRRAEAARDETSSYDHYTIYPTKVNKP